MWRKSVMLSCCRKNVIVYLISSWNVLCVAGIEEGEEGETKDTEPEITIERDETLLKVHA